jgi:hypothetical protein
MTLPWLGAADNHLSQIVEKLPLIYQDPRLIRGPLTQIIEQALATFLGKCVNDILRGCGGSRLEFRRENRDFATSGTVGYLADGAR